MRRGQCILSITTAETCHEEIDSALARVLHVRVGCAQEHTLAEDKHAESIVHLLLHFFTVWKDFIGGISCLFLDRSY